MKKSEVGELLAAVAATDNRTTGTLDINTWSAILPPDMTLTDAMAALIKHRQTSTEWLMPKHIIDAVGSVRRQRLKDAGDPPMPGDLSWKQEKEWRQLWCEKVKDGATRDQAAAETSIALHVHELQAVENAEYVRAIEAFAGRKREPKAAPKPKRKRVEYVDDSEAAS